MEVEKDIKRKLAACSVAAIAAFGMLTMAGCQAQQSVPDNADNAAQTSGDGSKEHDGKQVSDTSNENTIDTAITESGAGAKLDWAVPTSSDATISFSDTEAKAEGKETAYELDGTRVKILEAGTYTLSGSCSDGSVTVGKDIEGQVNLILDGLNLTSSKGSPISIAKQDKALIIVKGDSTLTDAEDTANDLSDEQLATATEEQKEAAADFDGAAIHAKNGSIVGITGEAKLILDASKVKNGIKCEAESALVIGQGKDDKLTLDINAAKAGVKAEGTVDILGGNISVVAAGGDGIHSDTLLVIGTEGTGEESPKLSVEAGSEGLEGASVIINSGDISVKAHDDGINAANSDLSSWGYLLAVKGGKVYVDAEGDGLDSNKDMEISGGNITVLGASNDGNCAVDTGDGGYWKQTGGTIAAVGMTGMAESPTNGVYVRFGSSSGRGQQSTQQESTSIAIAAGDKVEIQSADGATVMSFDAAKQANSILFSTDGITADAEYKLVINGKEAASAKAQEGTGQPNASFGGGHGGKGNKEGGDNQFRHGQRPNASQENGTTPPAKPDGNAAPDGNQPAPPDGNQPAPPDGNQPPEAPDGNQPPEAPDGNAPAQSSEQGNSGMEA